MLNNTNKPTDALVLLATEAHRKAAATLESAAKRCREHGAGPLADLYSDDLDTAFEAFSVACDDLREIRDGYRYTYPHPVALVPHGRRYPVR